MSEEGDREPKRLIYEMRRRVQAARNQFWSEGVEGHLSNQTHLELAKATLQYHDVLYEFRSSNAIDESDWPDISPLRARVGRRIEREVDSAGRGRGKTTKTVPAVTEIPVEHIVELTEELDDLAKKLGFGAAERSVTEHNDIEHDDLAALLEARGQDEALEKIPGGG